MTKNRPASSAPQNVDLAAEVERLEDLAMLADGTLDAERRVRLLASLSDDPDGLDLLAETMALLESMEAGEGEHFEDGDADSGGGRRPVVDEEDFDSQDADNVVYGPWRRPALAAVTTLAAAAALLLFLPRLLAPAPPTPQSLMVTLDPARLAGDVVGHPPWSQLRGGAGELEFEPVGARDSFRWGVLAADLEVALRGSDEPARQRIGAELDRVVHAYVAPIYGSLTDAATPAPEALDHHADLQADLLTFLDPFYYRYGLWTRAAWLASSSGQLEFFTRDTVRALDALEPPESLREEWSNLRIQVRDLESEDDLQQLATDLHAVLQRRSSWNVGS